MISFATIWSNIIIPAALAAAVRMDDWSYAGPFMAGSGGDPVAAFAGGIEQAWAVRATLPEQRFPSEFVRGGRVPWQQLQTSGCHACESTYNLLKQLLFLIHLITPKIQKRKCLLQ